MDFRIVPIEHKHVPGIVDVHLRAFPGFFLTFLGPKFLAVFYGSFLVDPTGVALVAEEPHAGRVLGFVAGPFAPTGYFKRLLKRRWWAFCLASVRAILRRPAVIKRLFRAVFYRGQAPPGPPRSLLSAIAVAPEAQGRNIGRSLLDAWVAEVRRRGSPGCFLTTDAEDNERINRFYESCGWRVESAYTTPEGRLMNRYVLDFARQGAGENAQPN